jgi:hypothetical protein
MTSSVSSNFPGVPAFELRFADLFNPWHGYAFPCDAEGHVDIDSLGREARVNYLYARTVIGREVGAPVTCVVEEGRAEATR